MARTINGYPASFYKVTAPKWCRHKDQYVAYEFGEDFATASLTTRATCSNCGADTGELDAGLQGTKSVAAATDVARKLAHDALMKIEKVGAVSEVAP